MTKITELPLASPLGDTEQLEIVQDGANKRIPASALRVAGKSAYELAVFNGNFTGTEQEFLVFIKGEPGPIGPQGIPGPIGLTGLDGAKGDKGAVGEQGIQGPIGNTGNQGATGERGLTGLDGQQGLKGDPGERGIQGEVGGEGPQGLIGPQGEVGATGQSAYQAMQGSGYTGTEAEWVASLQPNLAGAVVVSHAFLTSESITKGMFVNVWNNAGVPNIRCATAEVEGKQAHGFILNDVASGLLATVYFAGVNDQCTGLSVGDQYLSVAPGVSSSFTPNTSGHVLQTLGLAISATTMFLIQAMPLF